MTRWRNLPESYKPRVHLLPSPNFLSFLQLNQYLLGRRPWGAKYIEVNMSKYSWNGFFLGENLLFVSSSSWWLQAFLFFSLLKRLILYWHIVNNSVLIVSGEQRRDSAIHIHVCILPQTPSHPGCHITLSRVPCAIYTVTPGWLSVLNIEKVDTSIPNSLTVASACPSPGSHVCSLNL